MNKRILFIANDAGKYGANQSLINILSSLKEKNIFVTVVFPVRGGICEIFEEKGWDYYIVNYRTELCSKSNGYIGLVKNALRSYKKSYINSNALKVLCDVVKDNNINIIHSNSSVVSIGVDLAKRMKIHHVWHLREYIHPNFEMYVFGGLEKYKQKIKNTNNIICITKGVAYCFDVEKQAYILNDAVRKEVMYTKPISKSKYFLFCGSIVKNKGIEEAIEAFHKIFMKHPNYKLIIVGEGASDYEIYLKEKVKFLGIDENVEFLGFRKDVDDLMVKATAFLMCSRNEALGRVTIEAMMNFCLVIGYNESGTAEIIEHKKTGLLYKSQEELVTYMNDIIVNYEFFDDVLDNAYKFALDGFLERKFGDCLLNYYESLN
jgi:glycosyltransferase involved in cell wall biosynthesis